MCWRIAKTDAQLLAALLYRDAACYAAMNRQVFASSRNTDAKPLRE